MTSNRRNHHLSTYEVPTMLINPHTLPPPLMTSEPGSFAYNTFKVRIPAIIDDVCTANQFPDRTLAAMRDLRNEITDGTIHTLAETTPDQHFWNAVSAPWIGRRWLEVPWYWAESYFY